MYFYKNRIKIYLNRKWLKLLILLLLLKAVKNKLKWRKKTQNHLQIIKKIAEVFGAIKRSKVNKMNMKYQAWRKQYQIQKVLQDLEADIYKDRVIWLMRSMRDNEWEFYAKESMNITF